MKTRSIKSLTKDRPVNRAAAFELGCLKVLYDMETLLFRSIPPISDMEHLKREFEEYKMTLKG